MDIQGSLNPKEGGQVYLGVKGKCLLRGSETTMTDVTEPRFKQTANVQYPITLHVM